MAANSFSGIQNELKEVCEGLLAQVKQVSIPDWAKHCVQSPIIAQGAELSLSIHDVKGSFLRRCQFVHNSLYKSLQQLPNVKIFCVQKLFGNGTVEPNEL